ncbi:hypothetical protein CIP107543_00094 [Corynebacterium diphtheriae]|nr:hypothetical protein CIP107543_00094 [Corynebacterium diphtheriae]
MTMRTYKTHTQTAKMLSKSASIIAVKILQKQQKSTGEK